MSEQVLVADDDMTFGLRLQGILQRRAVTVALAVTIADVFDLLASRGPFSVVVVGRTVGALSGQSVLDALKNTDRLSTAAVLRIERSSNSKADQYWTVITETRRLADAVEKTFGRTTTAPYPRQSGPLIVNPENHEVRLRARLLNLSPREIQVLYYLVERVGQLVTRDELLASVWGDDRTVKSQIVDVYLKRLRAVCLAKTGELSFRTVSKMGYQLLLRPSKADGR
jgi:two-component system, OmpR family, alkaline phosphatase synthesis response regulator PhoP